MKVDLDPQIPQPLSPATVAVVGTRSSTTRGLGAFFWRGASAVDQDGHAAGADQRDHQSQEPVLEAKVDGEADGGRTYDLVLCFSSRESVDRALLCGTWYCSFLSRVTPDVKR